MPYDGNDDQTNDLADQILIVEDRVINTYSDYYKLFGCDLNVDFSRDRLHTALLTSFCHNFGLNVIERHDRRSLDNTYHFSMHRFSVLDYFLIISHNFRKLSGTCIRYS